MQGGTTAGINASTTPILTVVLMLMVPSRAGLEVKRKEEVRTLQLLFKVVVVAVVSHISRIGCQPEKKGGHVKAAWR